MKPSWSWYFKMAIRDSRRQPARLLLFISSIVLGIAAMVAINTFIENVQHDIENEARELLGTDISIGDNRRLDKELDQLLDSMGYPIAKELKFNSMLQLVGKEGTRLVNVVGTDGKFPFYGAIETSPEAAVKEYQSGNNALLDKTLMIQFGLVVGDSIQLGEQRFKVEGQLDKTPGQTGFASSIAPAILIPINWVDATGLIQYGSRLNEYRYLKIEKEEDVEKARSLLSEKAKDKTLRIQSYQSRSERTGEAFGDAGRFLNLVAFVALLLGCIGIASTVNIYIRAKFKEVAILSCIGIPGHKAFRIYGIQILIFSFIGAFIGSILGSTLAYFMPLLLSDFLPVEVNYSLSASAILFGIGTGVVASILFTLTPLFRLANATPLLALRSFIDQIELNFFQRAVSILAMALFMLSFSYFLLESVLQAFIFTLGCAACLLLLLGAAWFIRWLAKKMVRPQWPFVVKQAIAGLYRPNNQTSVLISTIGLGTSLIALLFVTQDMLLNKVSFTSAENDPNMILFGIQTPQLNDVKEAIKAENMDIQSAVPLVTMRLEKLRGETKDFYFPEDQKEEDEKVADHIFNREWRVTFRDSLIDSEKIVEGEWIGSWSGEGDIPLSVELRTLGSMDGKVGDRLIFNVQGTPINCYIASVREVNWNQISTNFTLLFPNNVLEKAPQTHAIMTQVASPEQSAIFQQKFMKQFPTLAIVDLNYILETVTEVIDKLKFVITFMSLFSILTGFVVLIASIFNSRFQRIRETVLLKTLGASRKQVTQIALLEYLLLGSFAGIIGVFLALAGGYALSLTLFDALFVPNFMVLGATVLSIALLVTFIGYLNNRTIVGQPPLEVLRKEV